MVDFLLKIVGYIVGYTFCICCIIYSIMMVIGLIRMCLGKGDSSLPREIRKGLRGW